MKTHDLKEILSNHPYPGRGIVLGRTADNSKAAIAYFIMGRSENSRNRVLRKPRTASAPRHLTRARWWTPLSLSTIL